MPNRLVNAVSPYLRSHAENPVDWREWGSAPFEEAAERDVPVLVSIGYSTCHWCHVMARESFSDPDLAAHLNERFVAIKVDREEYPDVDASYLAAAGAFTQNLGWPLNVFVTPSGLAFFAGTYFPPLPAQGHPSFRTVLDAVTDAWTNRRAEVDANAHAIAEALNVGAAGEQGDLPSADAFRRAVLELVGYEDTEHGGFGAAPKFPVAPVIAMLLDRGSVGDADAAALAARTLDAMAASDLRDGVEGGFFRYSTRRDWSDPHYERMLYDNAQLLGSYARVGNETVAEGIAVFLRDVMRLEGGTFASAQDSESTVDGERVEGAYYALDAAGRARQHPPALDEKVLTGWNGLAIEALARAGTRLGREEWVQLARTASDRLLATHLRAGGTLVRASIGATVSPATSTLEDYGMFASGLLAVSLATGEVSYAIAARSLVDATMAAAIGDAPLIGDDVPEPGAPGAPGAPAERNGSDAAMPFAAPGGGDPVLREQGVATDVDPSEGAYPSGISAMANAANTIFLLTADRRYRDAGIAAMRTVGSFASERPISFGGALSAITAIQSPVAQLVIVGTGDPALADVALGWDRAGAVVAQVTDSQAASFAEAGFELFDGRTSIDGSATAYLCRDFVCRLPITRARDLTTALGEA